MKFLKQNFTLKYIKSIFLSAFRNAKNFFNTNRMSMKTNQFNYEFNYRKSISMNINFVIKVNKVYINFFIQFHVSVSQLVYFT